MWVGVRVAPRFRPGAIMASCFKNQRCSRRCKPRIKSRPRPSPSRTAAPSWCWKETKSYRSDDQWPLFSTHQQLLSVTARLVFLLSATELHCCPKSVTNTSMSLPVVASLAWTHSHLPQIHPPLKIVPNKNSMSSCLWQIVIGFQSSVNLLDYLSCVQGKQVSLHSN